MSSSLVTRGCPYCLIDRGIPSYISREANFYAGTGAKAKIAQVFNTHP